MKNRLSNAILAIFCFALLTALPARAQAPKAQTGYRPPVHAELTTPAIDRKVEELLKKMTLEEKVGQLVQYSIGSPTGPGTGRTGYDEMIANGQVGSVFNLSGPEEVNKYQHIAVEKSRLHIPLLVGLDVIHGYRTGFPVPLALSATWDPQVVEDASRVAAQEASAGGVRWTFSPMVDIARDPRWGRMVEGAGEDPYLGSVMARAYVHGYQGKNLADPGSIASCAKHYVGYGAAEGGRDYNTTEISEHTLREVYLPPFYAALDAGGATIMSAFNSIGGVPSSANPFTLTQVLRNEWKFKGLVVSDWTSLGELIEHGIANDGSTTAYKSFTAGVDMDMESNLYHQYLVELVKSGKISQAQLDESVRRALRVKFALGLFENPYTDASKEHRGPIPVGSLEVARKAAERSFVLLKNAPVNGSPLLPLSANVGKVALIGPLADDRAMMLGAWGGHGNPEDVVTVRSALETKLGANRVAYASGGHILQTTDAELNEAVAAAQSADVAVLALGEDGPEMTGEASSRAHLNLPGRQRELLEKVSATGKPVVLLLFSGRPLTLPWVFERVPAVMEVWFPGVQAGPAITKTLFGESVPSGRLTVSWPRNVGQIPDYYNALNTGRPATGIDLSRPPRDGEEKYHSRYVDETNTPQFPFGFGLSYTDFTISDPTLSTSKLSARTLNAALQKNQAGAGSTVEVKAKVSNTGKVAAEDVVQLYIRLRGTSVAEPVRSLKGFQRVLLAPGETKEVTFTLTPPSLAMWGSDNNWQVEPSKVTVWVSGDSARGNGVPLEITE